MFGEKVPGEDNKEKSDVKEQKKEDVQLSEKKDIYPINPKVELFVNVLKRQDWIEAFRMKVGMNKLFNDSERYKPDGRTPDTGKDSELLQRAQKSYLMDQVRTQVPVLKDTLKETTDRQDFYIKLGFEIEEYAKRAADKMDQTLEDVYAQM